MGSSMTAETYDPTMSKSHTPISKQRIQDGFMAALKSVYDFYWTAENLSELLVPPQFLTLFIW
jgi:hypothetical protein